MPCLVHVIFLVFYLNRASSAARGTGPPANSKDWTNLRDRKAMTTPPAFRLHRDSLGCIDRLQEARRAHRSGILHRPQTGTAKSAGDLMTQHLRTLRSRPRTNRPVLPALKLSICFGHIARRGDTARLVCAANRWFNRRVSALTEFCNSRRAEPTFRAIRDESLAHGASCVRDGIRWLIDMSHA